MSYGIIIVMKKLTRNNWVKSIVINLIILIAVMLLTDVTYETNDDYAIACRIVDEYAHVNFINYYLCKMLIPIQLLLPGINVYILFQIAVSFIAFVFILKVILDKTQSKLSNSENALSGNAALFINIFLALTILLYSVDHYCNIQFTKTAALLIVAGMLLMIDSMISKRRWYYYIYSVLFLYLGVAFRIDGLIAVIGFSGVFLIFWIIENRQKLKSEGYISFKRICIYLLLLAFIASCYGFDAASQRANTSNDELEKYKAYSELRSDVVDYPIYDFYSENEAAYDEIGISENDLYLVDHWYLDYNGAASSENLSNILAVDDGAAKSTKSIADAGKSFTGKVISSIKALSFTGIHIILLSVLAVWGMLCLKPRHSLYILTIAVLTVCLYLTLFYMGRPAYRAFYVADLGASICLLYYYSEFAGDAVQSNVIHQKLLDFVSVILIVILLLLTIPNLQNCGDRYDSMQNKIMSAELQKHLSQNSENMYIMSVSEKKFDPDYATPLSAPGRNGENNVIGTGSWGTMSPYVLDKLQKYDMVNPIKDLIDNDKAYYIGNKNIERLTEYYNKWYGSKDQKVKLIRTEEVSGYGVYRVLYE